jgi:hypothetical protein
VALVRRLQFGSRCPSKSALPFSEQVNTKTYYSAASTVLVFYGYDQGMFGGTIPQPICTNNSKGVFGNVIISENFLETFGTSTRQHL